MVKKIAIFILAYVGIGLLFFAIFISRFQQINGDFLPNLLSTLLNWPVYIFIFIGVLLGFLKVPSF